jgi:membrane fusion protein (multidrug efflux system)
LLPPENATGNFVKVVQRVPVKITFNDPGEALHWISPGMSVEARIFTADPPAWLGFLD